MQLPFDISIGNVIYSIFPEEADTYTVFKEGVEHFKIQKDTDEVWMKLNPETDLPMFDQDEEVNRIGRLIAEHREEDDDEEEPGDDDE